MPELPEVEITARQLRRWCVGRRIVRASALPGTPLRDIGHRAIASGLSGRLVRAVDRIGKQLFVRLDQDRTLLIHLGMTGKMVRSKGGDPLRPRLSLELDDGAQVALLDPRRFGRVRLLDDESASRHPEIAKLGPDALELAARSGGLAERLSSVRSPIKIALLDQRRLAGVGNIYASEALFTAKIHPSTPASLLDRRAYGRLAAALIRAMERTLAEEDGDELTYLLDDDEKNPFVIYGREGEPCPRCKAPIERTVQGGRSTFFCGRCQLAR